MAFDTSFYQSAFAQQLRMEGAIEGSVELLRRVLDRRGIAITDEQRALLDACTEFDLVHFFEKAEPCLERLDRWLDRAFTATSAAEVFDAD